MKPFNSYQNLPGYPMTDRDKKQVGSKFWGKGKWDNFVEPHLPKDCKGLSMVDMGCNAGLFLKFGQDRGFSKIIGVDSDPTAVKNGREYCKSINGKYEFIEEKMDNVIDQLPIVDYTILANAHYYFTIDKWMEYLDKLRLKTRYVIIVTAQKNHVNRCWASADVASIRNYFKDWQEVSFVDQLPLEGDPDPRQLWSLCFKNPLIESVEHETLDSSNHVQDDFYHELDEGKHYSETSYYRIYKRYRRNRWTPEKLERWFQERVDLYEKLKKSGQTEPILVNFFDPKMIVDGNHRYAMMRNLGYDKVFIRKV